MIWASRWSVALRTFYRQILSVLYSSFPFGNFRPRLVRALLVHVYGFIHIYTYYVYVSYVVKKIYVIQQYTYLQTVPCKADFVFFLERVIVG